MEHTESYDIVYLYTVVYNLISTFQNHGPMSTTHKISRRCDRKEFLSFLKSFQATLALYIIKTSELNIKNKIIKIIH